MLDDSSSENMKAPVYQVSYTYRCSDFDDLVNIVEPGFELKSKEFSHPETPSIKWHLLIFPNGNIEKNKSKVTSKTCGF